MLFQESSIAHELEAKKLNWIVLNFLLAFDCVCPVEVEQEWNDDDGACDQRVV